MACLSFFSPGRKNNKQHDKHCMPSVQQMVLCQWKAAAVFCCSHWVNEPLTRVSNDKSRGGKKKISRLIKATNKNRPHDGSIFLRNTIFLKASRFYHVYDGFKTLLRVLVTHHHLCEHLEHHFGTSWKWSCQVEVRYPSQVASSQCSPPPSVWSPASPVSVISQTAPAARQQVDESR